MGETELYVGGGAATRPPRDDPTPHRNDSEAAPRLRRASWMSLRRGTRPGGGARPPGWGAVGRGVAWRALDHDGHALGVDRAEVGVLKEVDEVVLARLLQRHQRLRLPSLLTVRRRRVVRLRDLAHLGRGGVRAFGAAPLTGRKGGRTHQPRKRELANEQLRRALVLSDLPERHSARPARSASERPQPERVV